MTIIRQFKRAVNVTWGPLSTVQPTELDALPAIPTIGNLDDDGIRIDFDFERTSNGEPDRGKVRLWNLTRKTAESIRDDHEILSADRRRVFDVNRGPPRASSEVLAAQLKSINEGHRVEVSAGYGGKPELVFRGEYVNVKTRKRVSATDFVTEIDLGDTFTSLRDGFLDNPLGLGVTIPQLVQQFSDATGIRTNKDAALRIAAVAPTATVTVFQNGAAGAIRAPEMMDDLADYLGLTWFVRNGELFFLPQGGAIQDFAVPLRAGLDLLDFSDTRGFKDISGKANMNPRIEPGRGLIIFDEAGKLVGNGFGFVVKFARYRGDTHGKDFFTEFEATESVEPIPGIAEFGTSIAQAAGLVG